MLQSNHCMKLSHSLRTWMASKRNIGSCLSLFLVLGLVAVLLFAPDLALAVTPTAAQQMTVMDTVFGFLSSLILGFVNFLGFMITLITEIALVPVMSYNGFATSAVIGAGWAVVRDVMNMGFVIVLLIIAIVTIFGGSVGSWSVKWQQQIPKLLLFAILINFSRMICSFLIDIGQVIMLTFANAIKDIAGGNIIQLFGLADFVTFDRAAIQETITSGGGTNSVSLFTSALLALVMTLIVLGTMIMLTVILVHRIVMLWVLVVLSPLAFFFGGAEVLGKGAGNPYAEWWSKFTGAVAIGPVLVFFLWLTLSVAGAGNIAATENFPMGGTSAQAGPVLGFLTKIADPGRFLSFIIGVGMLYVGFEASQKFANALPGAASSLLKGGMKSALKIGAGAGAVAGGGALVASYGAGIAATGALAFGGKKGVQFLGKTQAGQEARAGIGKGITSFGAGLGKVPGLGWAGRGVARVGTSLEQSRRQDSAARLDASSKEVEIYDKDQLDAGLSSAAIGPGGVMRQNAMRWKILNSSFLRKKYSSEDLSKIYQDFSETGGAEATKGDSSMAQKFADIQKARPDLLAADEKQDLLEKMEPEDLLRMDPEAYRDTAVQDALKRYTKYDPSEGYKTDRTYYDMMKDGKLGNIKQREALQGATDRGEAVDVDLISDDALSTLDPAKQTPAVLAGLVANGRIEVLMQSPEFQIQNLSGDYIRNSAAQIVEHATPEKVRELAESDKGDAFREGLGRAMAASEEGAQKRELGIQIVMHAPDASALSNTLGTGYNVGNNTFRADDGREAFRGAVQRDSGVLLKYADQVGKDGSDMGRVAAESANIGMLARNLRASTGAEKTQWVNLITSISEQMEARLNDLDGSEKKAMEKRQRRIDSIIISDTDVGTA